MAIVTDPTNNTVVTRDTDSVWSASDRPLAYVELISDIAPIANANTIEVATVRGWKVNTPLFTNIFFSHQWQCLGGSKEESVQTWGFCDIRRWLYHITIH